MAYPYTDTGYNMFDMLSMLQKSIRRGSFGNAGFAANQLKDSFRKVMWNRLLVITAEDCFGVLTKEIIRLREQDEQHPNNQNISNAVALLCMAKKNRDACYFACNFVLVSRRTREMNVLQTDIEQLYTRIMKRSDTKRENYLREDGYEAEHSQMSIFDNFQTDETDISISDKETERLAIGVRFETAISHKDMDMIGYEMNLMRNTNRDFLWDLILDFSANQAKGKIQSEIMALKTADNIINAKKKDKDEIFISKAVILLCQCNDPVFDSLKSCDVVSLEHNIDWTKIKTKSICGCFLVDGNIPEWVYDCHTLKGKKMGKTDWDMTTTEQEALYPLQKGYFDDASWIYAYEQDLKEGVITKEQMTPIWNYAETHKANPVSPLPYNEHPEK